MDEGSLPPATVHVLPLLLVRTSRAPHFELWDHTPRPVVALRNVIADSLAGATDLLLQTARLVVTTTGVVVVVAGVVVDVPVDDVDDVDDVDGGDAEVVQAARLIARTTIPVMPNLRRLVCAFTGAPVRLSTRDPHPSCARAAPSGERSTRPWC